MDQPDLEVIGEAGDCLELLDLLKKVKPHMIILDIRMPNKKGIEAIPEIRQIDPEVKILILSMYGEIEYLHQAFSAGANGYLVKGDTEPQMFLAIETIRRGEVFITPSLSADLVADWAQKNRNHQGASSIDPLTVREKEILRLIAEGNSYREVSRLLLISPNTVLRHRANIMEKLSIRKSTDLIKYAIQKTYISLG